jgi:MFS family permease
MKKSKFGRDIWFLLFESTLTSFILFMPVTWLLYSSIGLDQFQIGLTQFVFAITMLVLEVPTGYFADRVSRKISNAGGDLFLVVSMLVMFVASNFWHIIISEILFGIGLSLTNGADSALLKAHCESKGLSYKKLAAQLQSLSFASAGVGAIIGGVLGAHNIRWPFLFQAFVFFVATVVAFRIKNIGKTRESNVHPLRDVGRVVKYCVHGHPQLAWRIFLGAALMGSTYMIVWFLTPAFLAAGIDIAFHGVLFAAISVLAIIGSEFVAMDKKLSMTLPFLLSSIAYFAMGWQLSLLTVFLFLITSFARGINTARVKPYIQEITPNDIQATAISVYGMVYKVLSSSFGLMVNYIGNIKLEYGLLVGGVVCVVSWVFFVINKDRYELPGKTEIT